MKYRFKNLLGVNECWKNYNSATLSSTSLQSIAKHCIGETLSDNMLQAVAQIVRDDITKLLVEAVKYARRTRAEKVKMEHLLFAMQEQNASFDMLLMDYTWPESENGNDRFPTYPQSDLTNLEHEILSEFVPSDELIFEISTSATKWTKREQVLLMANKKFPLSKEQQEFYITITEACMGTSEPVRREALQRLTIDSSLQPMVPKLCLFIAEAVGVNLVQQNFAMLIYLLRMAQHLLGNSNLRLNNYVHILIPPLLSCTIGRQICSIPAVQNHWALREYSANILSETVKLFDCSENNVLFRIISVYKKGLQRSESLETIYGCIIGLSKIGKFAIRSCILPHIRFISQTIEPFLTQNDHYNANYNKQAAINIRHRILKICAPLLKNIHKPPDTIEKYSEEYGFLGPLLCDAVTIERIMEDVVKKAEEEALTAEIEEIDEFSV